MSTKKYSVLNLVNCILLALTLTFSVISYAWYSPAEELGTPLSFSAGDTGGLLSLTKLKVSDDDAPTLTLTPNLEFLSNKTFEETETVGEKTSLILNFGTIDDLGYLKNSNVVYYCLTIPVASGTTTLLNLSYDKTSFSIASEEGDPQRLAGYHFNLYEDAESGGYTLLDEALHTSAKNEESFGDNSETPEIEGIRTFLSYSCAVSDKAPGTIDAKYLLGLFATAQSGVNSLDHPISQPDFIPTSDTDCISLTAPEGTTQNYYVYIKIYPDLDNYHEFAQLLMDHMPFYVAFGLSLYVDVRPTVATASEEPQS